MVDLMLKDSGIPSAGVDVDGLCLFVKSFYPNGLGTWSYCLEPGEAKTTLEEETWRLIKYTLSL